MNILDILSFMLILLILSIPIIIEYFEMKQLREELKKAKDYIKQLENNNDLVYKINHEKNPVQLKITNAKNPKEYKMTYYFDEDEDKR